MIEIFAFNPPSRGTMKRASRMKRTSTKTKSKTKSSGQMTKWLDGQIKSTAKAPKGKSKIKNRSKTMARGRKPSRSTAARRAWAKRKGIPTYAKKRPMTKRARSVASQLGQARKRRPSRPFSYLKAHNVSPSSFINFRKKHPIDVRNFKKKYAKRPVKYLRKKYAANPSKYSAAKYRKFVSKYGGVVPASKAWNQYKRTGRMPVMSNPRRKPAKRRSYKRNRPRYTIAPVSANPRRRKTRKRSYKRNRPRYTIAPVAANPRGRYTLPRQFANNPGEAIMEFPKQILSVDFLTQNVLPVVGGAIGSKILAAQIAQRFLSDKNYSKFYASAAWKKAIWEASAGIVGGTAIGVLSKGKYTDIAMKAAAGGIIAGLLTIVDNQSQFEKVREYYSGKHGLSGGGMGDEIEDALKEQIAEELKTDLDGFDGFVTVDELPQAEPTSLEGFVTVDELPDNDNATTLDGFMASPEQF